MTRLISLERRLSHVDITSLIKSKLSNVLRYSGPFFSVLIVVVAIATLSYSGVMVTEPVGVKIVDVRHEPAVKIGETWNLTLDVRNYDLGFLGATFVLRFFFFSEDGFPACDQSMSVWIARGQTARLTWSYETGKTACLPIGNDSLQIEAFYDLYGELSMQNVKTIAVDVLS